MENKCHYHNFIIKYFYLRFKILLIKMGWRQIFYWLQ